MQQTRRATAQPSHSADTHTLLLQVKFIIPDCQQCLALAPDYKKVARNLKVRWPCL